MGAEYWTTALSQWAHWQPEYWATDTLGWAEPAEYCTYGNYPVSSFKSLSINYGHCPVSSLRAEYWTMDTVRWAHWELSIELWTLSGEPIESWVLNYGHCPVSSSELSIQLRILSGSPLETEYWTTGHCSGWAHWELSIELKWTLIRWLIRSWIFNSGHCPASSLRVEYSTYGHLSGELIALEYSNYGHCPWAHWELSIQLRTQSNELFRVGIEQWTLLLKPIESWVFNYGHCPVSSLRAEYWDSDTRRCPLRAEYWTTDTVRWAHWDWVLN